MTTVCLLVLTGCGKKNDGAGLPLASYQNSVSQGYTGTLAQWLDELMTTKDSNGLEGYAAMVANGYTGSEADWLLSMIGLPD